MNVYLSYSSLNMLHNSPHQWANKMMGIEVPENEFLTRGKEGHRIIQDHVSGKKGHLALGHIKYNFPIVEEKDFDEKCKFVKYIKDGADTFIVQGFADGMNREENRLLEIKLSSAPWSAGKFKKAMQRKMYAWGFGFFEEAILITGSTRPEEWLASPLSVISCPMTKTDAQEAEDFIHEGIRILRAGDFTGDLDENGRCSDRYCLYGVNCFFK